MDLLGLFGYADDGKTNPAPAPDARGKIKVSAANARLGFHGCAPEFIRNVCHGACCETKTPGTDKGILIVIYRNEAAALAARGATVDIPEDASKDACIMRTGGKGGKGDKDGPRCGFKTHDHLCGLHFERTAERTAERSTKANENEANENEANENEANENEANENEANENTDSKVKPWTCRAAPWHLNRSGTLIIRNHYKMFRCYRHSRINPDTGPGGETLPPLPPLPAYVAFRDGLDMIFGAAEAGRIVAHFEAGGDDVWGVALPGVIERIRARDQTVTQADARTPAMIARRNRSDGIRRARRRTRLAIAGVAVPLAGAD